MMKHQHKACVACFHLRAHGLWEGFTLAYVELLKAGYQDAANILEDRQRKIVNREVRKLGVIWGLDNEALDKLMRHHGVRVRKGSVSRHS